MNKKIFNKRNLVLLLVVLLLIALLVYFYTYFFSKDSGKVIYQDAQRRIYLNEKKLYGKKDREMWRMVYEDQKTGNRFFVLGNSPKGYPNAKMAKIILNTIDQGKMKSFDLVERVGITMKEGKTDIHSNLVEKKSVDGYFPDMSELDFAA